MGLGGIQAHACVGSELSKSDLKKIFNKSMELEYGEKSQWDVSDESKCECGKIITKDTTCNQFACFANFDWECDAKNVLGPAGLSVNNFIDSSESNSSGSYLCIDSEYESSKEDIVTRLSIPSQEELMNFKDFIEKLSLECDPDPEFICISGISYE